MIDCSDIGEESAEEEAMKVQKDIDPIYHKLDQFEPTAQAGGPRLTGGAAVAHAQKMTRKQGQ